MFTSRIYTSPNQQEKKQKPESTGTVWGQKAGQRMPCESGGGKQSIAGINCRMSTIRHPVVLGVGHAIYSERNTELRLHKCEFSLSMC